MANTEQALKKRIREGVLRLIANAGFYEDDGAHPDPTVDVWYPQFHLAPSRIITALQSPRTSPCEFDRNFQPDEGSTRSIYDCNPYYVPNRDGIIEDTLQEMLDDGYLFFIDTRGEGGHSKGGYYITPKGAKAIGDKQLVKAFKALTEINMPMARVTTVAAALAQRNAPATEAALNQLNGNTQTPDR